jgi:hypothetical protein
LAFDEKKNDYVAKSYPSLDSNSTAPATFYSGAEGITIGMALIGVVVACL